MMHARPAVLIAFLAGATALLVTACATNPVSGKSEMALMSEAEEIATGKKLHVQVTQQMGVYDDPALADYVQELGTRLAKSSHRPNLDWHFTVVDTDDVNAFALPGGYVYISRGILPYLNSEAELAAVLGHEIGHVTARHSVQQQSQSTVAGVAAAAAAILTGQQAVGELANYAGTALIRGYGREDELEADRLGAEYLARTAYDPDAIIEVVTVLKDQEMFERELARAEGREPRIYHGVFSTHPDNDTRLKQAIAAAHKVEGAATGQVANRETFLKITEGLAIGSSRNQGMVRGNRLYHAGFQMTMAFPQGWQVVNEPQRMLAVAPDKNSYLEVTAQGAPAGVTNARDFLTRALANQSLTGAQQLNANGLDGYAVVARGQKTPFGTGNVRYAVVNFNNLLCFFRGASGGQTDVPAADGLILSTAQTLRRLKDNEFALAEPYKLRLVRAREGTRIEDLAKDSPLKGNAVQQLRLMNDLYPDRQPKAGDWVKVVR